jgi:hypothetical protein
MMFIVVGAWISPLAIGALALGITLGLQAQWWAVLLVLAACVALTAVIVLLLKRWSDRQAAAVFAAREPLRVTAERVTPLPRTERPAIEYHVHYHAADGQALALPHDPAAGRQHPARIERAGPPA